MELTEVLARMLENFLLLTYLSKTLTLSTLWSLAKLSMNLKSLKYTCCFYKITIKIFLFLPDL